MSALRRSGGEGGFTLVEMVITALVSGILMVVVANLFIGTFKGWLFNYSTIIAQQKARIVRDSMNKNLRQAQASTIEISRLNGNQPYRSMITFTDVLGKNWAYFQKDNQAYISTWTGNPRSVTLNAPVIPSKLQRLVFYHPDLKDMRNIDFSMVLQWNLLADNRMKPVTIHMVGQVEIRDP